MTLFPENISTYGQEIDRLFYTISALVAVAFVISLFILLYPLFNNGAKRVKKASYFTGGKRTHFKWVAIAMLAMAMSDFYFLYAEHGAWVTIEETQVKPDFHVAVTGRQWNWAFTYPGPDGKLYTKDDVVINEMNSELHVPINKNIVVDLWAKDVLHSFFVSNIRLKQDCVPGRLIQRWFNLTKTGTYDIACAELCGVLHGKMRNFLVVDNQQRFDGYIDSLYKAHAPAPAITMTNPSN